jgi:hypothetical protein
MIPLIIILLLTEGMALLPEQVVVPFPGLFRLKDTFLPIIVVFFAYILITGKLERLKSRFSPLILVFVFLIFFNVILANLHFGQPITDGFRVLRHYLFYLVFFVFVTFINTPKQFKRFVVGFTLLSLSFAVLSLVQYYMPSVEIFHYIEDAIYADDGIAKSRFEEFRLFNPALQLNVLSYFMALSFLLFSEDRPGRGKALLGLFFLTLFLFFVFFKMQSRMRLAGILLVTLVGVFQGRRLSFRVVAFALVILVLSYEVLTVAIGHKDIPTLRDTLIYSLFESGVLEATEVEKKGGGRLEQTLTYLKYASKYPVFGSGTLAPGSPLTRRFGLSPSSDVGYVRLLGEFGVCGIVWLGLLGFFFYTKSRQINKAVDDVTGEAGFYYCIVRGLQLTFLYYYVTFLTLPHFIWPKRIIFVALVLALLEVSGRRLLSITDRAVSQRPKELGRVRA